MARHSLNGAPAMDDPRRCQSKRNHRQWAIKGTKYCRFCCGTRKNHNGGTRPIMPRYYKKHLTDTLNDAVAAQLDVDPKEQVSLFEELALMREHTGMLVALWSAASDKATPETVIACGMEMSASLQEVTKLAVAANNIVNGGKDQYSIHDLKYVVMQLIMIMHEVCGDENLDLAKEFEALVKSRLVLPKSPEATELTPDLDVQAMDAMIPAEPDS